MGMFHYSNNIAKECNNNIVCASLFHHILYWVEKNRHLKKMLYDENYWVYQSYQQLEKRFGFLTKRQIQFSLKKLEEKDLIKSTTQYRDEPSVGIFKSTKWYTITNKGYEILGDDIHYVKDQIEGNRVKKEEKDKEERLWKNHEVLR